MGLRHEGWASAYGAGRLSFVTCFAHLTMTFLGFQYPKVAKIR